MTLPEGIYTPEELNAFKVLFDTYYESIRNFIYYKTGDMSQAEDIAQDTFLKVWEIRSTVKNETVKSLLYTIAINKLKSHFRHKKVVFQFANTQKDVDLNISEPADASIARKELQLKLQVALAEMSEKNREVFLLNRLENLSYNEIAERLQISTKAIEKRMHEALLVIRKHIHYKI